MPLIFQIDQFPWWSWLIIAAIPIVFFLIWRSRKPKEPEVPYGVIGMWHLGFNDHIHWHRSALGISIGFFDTASTRYADQMASAVDRAFERLMADSDWPQFRHPSDYFVLICNATEQDSNGRPALRVTPVPPGLIGSKYDKGGYLLGAGVTVGVLGDIRISPPTAILPNIQNVGDLDYFENAAKHEFEHRFAEQNPAYHRTRVIGGIWDGKRYGPEQHPFFPL